MHSELQPNMSSRSIPLARHFLLALLFTAVVAGCAISGSESVSPVWTERGAPSSAVALPPGFRISPARAYAIARESRRISLKHIWHIYADSRFYYVHDTFLGSGPRQARATGLRIDGQTGEIVPR
jgi:hypothetical protein